jgi:hypothetical protein
VKVEVLIFKGCPHANAAIELVREVVANLAPGPLLRKKYGCINFSGLAGVNVGTRNMILWHPTIP